MTDIQKKRLAGTAAIVMTSIVLSRLTGFIREMLLPNIVGANNLGDAYNIAFKITGLMYDMLVGGVIAAAIIPILSGYLARNEEEDGWKAVGTFINIVFVAMLVTSLLGIIFAPQIVNIVGVGLSSSAKAVTVRLSRILFPSVAFLMLAGLTNGVLNSYQKFAAAACGPSIYNLGSAASILLFGGHSVELVAVGVMCSSFIYFIIQLLFALKNLKYYRLKFYFRHPGVKRLFTLAIPSLLSSSIVQVNAIITASFATIFGESNVTALQLADRIWQMPYGVFAQGIGMAMLPTLSMNVAVGDVEQYRNTLSKGLKMVMILTVPSAVGFIVLSKQIITSIQITGKFTDAAVLNSANILMFFSIALLTQSIVTVINRAYYANNDTRTPLFIGASTIILNITLSYILKDTVLGVSGMALAYSAASALNAALLLIILDRKYKGINVRQLFRFEAKIIPAAVIMGVILYFISGAVPFNQSSKIMQCLILLFEIFAGAAIYFATALIIRVEEARYIINTIKGRLLRLANGLKR